MKLILWDIDGTILRTVFHGRDLMHQVGRGLFGEAFSLDGIEIGGQVDRALFCHAMTQADREVNDANWQQFRDAFAQSLREALAPDRRQVQVLPGVVELIHLFHERADVTNGLVTGNFRQAAHFKLQSAGLNPDLFHPAAYGCDSECRNELVALAIERGGNGFIGHNVIVIGDTTRDIACAKANGVLAFGVATGQQSRQALIEAGADITVDDLGDPAPLLALLD